MVCMFDFENFRATSIRLRAMTALLAFVATTHAPVQTFAEDQPTFESLDAYDAMQKGNQLLRQGEAETALRAYDRVEELMPDAREVPFGKGIGQYKLNRFDEARRAFEQAALSRDPKLAADAQYGIGAAHHAQALETMSSPDAQNPEQGKEALSHLESAMQQYRRVLTDHPDHKASREADLKAAHLWRQLKQQQQQQQQQSGDKSDEKNDEEKENENGEKKESGEKNEDQKKEQNEQNEQSNENQENKESSQQDQQGEQKDQKESNADEKKESEEKQPSQSEENKEQEAQPAQAEKQEERDAKEQADRRLRELMQTLKDRQKQRKHQLQRPVIAPPEKDW